MSPRFGRRDFLAAVSASPLGMGPLGLNPDEEAGSCLPRPARSTWPSWCPKAPPSSTSQVPGRCSRTRWCPRAERSHEEQMPFRLFTVGRQPRPGAGDRRAPDHARPHGRRRLCATRHRRAGDACFCPRDRLAAPGQHYGRPHGIGVHGRLRPRARRTPGGKDGHHPPRLPRSVRSGVPRREGRAGAAIRGRRANRHRRGPHLRDRPRPACGGALLRRGVADATARYMEYERSRV